MERIKSYLNQAAEIWGSCSFQDILPLFPTKFKNRISEGATSVITFLFGYYIGNNTNRNISRYAIVDDYHTILRPYLDNIASTLEKAFPNERFTAFIDSSPINEVLAAYYAGLGEIGMNGQLLNAQYGSYCFIGEIVTTMQLTYATNLQKNICTKCGLCLRACPTGALSVNGLNRERCRSHITQKKGTLTEWECMQIKLGGMAWGCDLCTDACPANKNVEKSKVQAFYNAPVSLLDEISVKDLCEKKAYGWRGEKVLLRNLYILKNNTLKL